MEIKKGDIVGRKSYGKDIVFFVDRIIKVKNGKSYAILKGVNYRIEADSPIEDLEKIVQELEKGELTLEDSVNKFEEGIKISKECNKTLEEAEKKIRLWD